MDLSINRQQEELINLVKDLSREIRSYSLERDFLDSEAFDWRLVDLLRHNNLLCPTLPAEFGGLGLDMTTTVMLIEELAAAYPALAAIVNTNIHAAQPLILAGPPELQREVLPRLAGAEAVLAAFALSEPAGGSDLEVMETRAVQKGRDYVLDGRKSYVINAPEADFITLFAFKTATGKKASLRCFVLPSSARGLSIGPLHRINAIEYARKAEIVLNKARVSEDRCIKSDENYSGYLLLNQTLDMGRVLIAATSVGTARAAYEIAREYAEQREQYGTVLKNHQAVGHALADMAVQIEMARLITWKAAWLADQGEDFTMMSAMAKLAASTMAQQVVSQSAEILAARAYEKGTLMEQLLRDVRILSTVEGTANIQRNLIVSLL